MLNTSSSSQENSVVRNHLNTDDKEIRGNGSSSNISQDDEEDIEVVNEDEIRLQRIKRMSREEYVDLDKAEKEWATTYVAEIRAADEGTR